MYVWSFQLHHMWIIGIGSVLGQTRWLVGHFSCIGRVILSISNKCAWEFWFFVATWRLVDNFLSPMGWLVMNSCYCDQEIVLALLRIRVRRPRLWPRFSLAHNLSLRLKVKIGFILELITKKFIFNLLNVIQRTGY